MLRSGQGKFEVAEFRLLCSPCLPAVALVSGGTVALLPLLALTEMDGGYLFQRAHTDAAPMQGALVEISTIILMVKDNVLEAKQVVFCKTHSLACEMWRFPMTICLPLAHIT